MRWIVTCSFSPLSSEFDVSKILIHGMKGDAALEVYELGRRNMETLYNACPWKWNAKAECFCDCVDGV